MKIVHVFKDYYPPTTGGIEQHMSMLCEGLSRHHDVAVLVPSRSRRTVEERLRGVMVVRVPEFGRYASVPLCPTMPARLKALRPDVVHLHFPNPLGDLAYLLATRGTPLVITYHADIVRQRALLPLYQPILRAVFRCAGRIIATSPDYIDSSPVLRQYRQRCVVIPFGVDPAAFALDEAGRAEADRISADAGRRLMLFVGVLRYYKGVDVLLRAMVKVRGHLLVVGRGPEQAALESEARRLGIEARVRFAGEVSNTALRAYLHACDVFVLPSIDRCEAFGIAQLEAMACGKPVVSSDLPTGMRFVNRDGVTGLLCPPGDSDALAAALTRLLDDGALRARMGKGALRRVEQEFSATRMIDRTLEVYESVRSGR